MGAIPLPVLSIKPPEMANPLDDLARVSQVKSILQNQQLQSQQIQMGQRQLDDDEKMRSAWQASGGDPDQYIKNLSKQGVSAKNVIAQSQALLSNFDKQVFRNGWSGMRLNAWKHAGLPIPEYERQNGRGTVETLSWHGDGTVVAPNKDLKTEDVEDLKDKIRAPFVLPTLQEVTEYCKERSNAVDPQR